MTANASHSDDILGAPIGLVQVGKTTYTVHRLATGPNARAAGIENNFALIGPKGAQFFVTDHGPRYLLNAIAIGVSISPRRMRGLTREHLAAFGVRV